jgi:hypothetical protein
MMINDPSRWAYFTKHSLQEESWLQMSGPTEIKMRDIHDKESPLLLKLLEELRLFLLSTLSILY